MRTLLLLLAVAGCSKKSEPKPAPVAPAPGCNLDGDYRLRFDGERSHGLWLRLSVTGDAVKVAGATKPLGLDEPGELAVKADRQACTLTLGKHTKAAGDVRIAVTVAAAKVTGTLARTDGSDKGTSPIAGIHDVTPQAYPSCIEPGVYGLSVASEKCATDEPTYVRLEMLGDELVIGNPAPEGPFVDDGDTATLTRTADCEYDLTYAHAGLKIPTTHVVFAGDKLTGTTKGAAIGDCTLAEAPLSGERVAD